MTDSIYLIRKVR